MPSIDVAMRRSLSASALDLLTAAMRPVVQEVQQVQPRDLITDTKGKITDVKTAFSSWDNCMKADFCKWPVIAIIVIGGLFILSIVWCCARCLFCGVSCCCECFYCLKCCGNCCGCCDPPQKKHKYLDEPYIPPHQGYRMEAPMTAPMAGGGAAGAMGAKSVHNAHNEAPQYAEFDMSKKGGEDALPEMPSWEGSGNRKVEVEQEAVELEQLNKPATNGHQPGQNVPLMTGTATTPGPVSPVSPLAQDPYGHPGSRQGSNAYLAGGAGAEPYARQGPDYGANDGYGQSTSNLSMDQGHPGGMNHGYGMAAAGMAGGAMAGATMGSTQRSPREYGGNGRYGTPPPIGQGYPGPRSSPGPGRQGSYDSYRRNGSGPPGAMPGFGSDSLQREPRLPDVMGGAYADKGPRRSPAPQVDQGYRGGYNRSPAPPYGPPQPQRQYSSDSTRPLARGPPQRQFSPAPVSPTTLQNNGGFDFNSGYSRPSTSDNNNSFDQPRHASPQPQPQQHTGGAAGGGSAYPGFKAYQPPQAASNSRPHENWSGL